ncbi:MAG: ribosome-associated translation inhibitor RaiA [Erysipelotrichaceae bacterium]|nr:ribosome-associated translation inhibitor RaiA [Erysipelotrichaceae bacterium]MCI9313237.1 ribosome-associated translation inhibitor RaiA [Erysipelotrichaceae bacterium]
MKVQIYGKNITVTPAIAEKIELKLSRLERYFIIEEHNVANVVVRVYPNKQKIEVTIPTKYAVLRAEVVHDDLYAAIDLAVDKLEDQIRRQKTRLNRKHKEKLAMAFLDHEELSIGKADMDEDELVRTKTIVPDPMELDEAIMRMEMLNHSFFIYRDKESDSIAVVYKRLDGGYGLIETEE